MSNENSKAESETPFEAGEDFVVRKGEATVTPPNLQSLALTIEGDKIPMDKWKAMAKCPVSAVVWTHRDKLRGNSYNPNHVAIPELDLLERSIVEDGWTQPIVITKDYEIVDGYHRWTVSGRAAVYDITGGFVPVVVMEDKPLADRMMATIRHNRARGQHTVLGMADIVGELTRNGHTVEELEERLGMEAEEIDRLTDEAGLPDRATRDHQDFNKGWTTKAQDGSDAGSKG